MISVWSRLLNLISPQRCVSCGLRLTPGEDIVCAKCNLHLPRTRYQEDPYENAMATMFWGQMKIKRCAAFLFYSAGSEAGNIICQMKYHGHPEIGRKMGRKMGSELMPSGFFEGIDLLIPLPLGRNRLRQRGFNQSAEIARGISEVTGIPVGERIVSRSQFKESQTHKGRWERNENVKDAFRLENAGAVKDKHLLLIDDVATTGATLIACGSELLKAEGAQVSSLTLAYAKT